MTDLLEHVQGVRRLNIGPNDRIVVTVRDHLSVTPESIKEIRKQLVEFLGIDDHRLMVLAGLDLAVAEDSEE